MVCGRHRRGFTLFEAALALGLGLALVALMLTFYDHILGIRTSIMDEVDFLKMKRLVMEDLTDQLRAAVPLEGGVGGGENAIQITTARLPGPAAWAEPTITEEPLPAESDLAEVVYRLRIVEDEYGDLVVVGVERVLRKVLRARLIEETAQAEVVLLSDRIKFLYFRYWDGAAWLPNWGGGDAPLAVEINLGVEPLPEDTDPEEYPYEVYRRVVYVPAGTQAQQGTVVRGLEGGGTEGGGMGGPGRFGR